MQEAQHTPTEVQVITTHEAPHSRASSAQPIVDQDDLILAYRHQMYVDFVASGGLRVTEDGDFEQITVTQLAKDLQVNRTTIYDWPKIIPNFKERVAKRRSEINGGNSLAAVWRGVKLAAIGGNIQAADMYFTNFDPTYKRPGAKVEEKGEVDFANLLIEARDAGVVFDEAEVIEH